MVIFGIIYHSYGLNSNIIFSWILTIAKKKKRNTKNNFLLKLISVACCQSHNKWFLKVYNKCPTKAMIFFIAYTLPLSAPGK
jgi:hypothetical protein